MIFEVECDTTKDELTDRTEHTMIVPFFVLDVKIYSYRRVEQSPAIEEAPGQGPDDRGLEEAEPVQGGEHQVWGLLCEVGSTANC